MPKSNYLRSWTILGLFLSGLNAFSQDRQITASFRDFTGGLNDTSAPINLNRNESPNLRNFYIDEILGALVQRKGFTKCGDLPSGNTATGLWKYALAKGTASLVISDGANFYETKDCQTWTTIQTGYDSSAIPDCEGVYDELWCTNGVNPVFSWDGTSRKLLDGSSVYANVPRGEFIEFEQDTVWIARGAADKSSVFFSNRSDPRTGDLIVPVSSAAWPATNELRISANDGETIRGIQRYQGGVTLCKDNSVYTLAGEDEFSYVFNRVLSNAGCFDRTMVEIDGHLYFMGQRGIYKFNGSSAELISENIRTLFSTIQKQPTNINSRVWDTSNNFNSGGSSQTSLSAGITLSGSFLLDNFSDGIFTSSPIWTVVSGSALASGLVPNSLAVADSYFTSFLELKVSTTNSKVETYQMGHISTGTWKFTFRLVSQAARPLNYLKMELSREANSPGVRIQQVRLGDNNYVFDVVVESTNGVLGRITRPYDTLPHDVTLKRASDGGFTLKYDGTADEIIGSGLFRSSITFAGFRMEAASGLSPLIHLTDVHVPTASVTGQVLSGSFTSEKFDASSALSSWSSFAAIISTFGQTITFKVKSATGSAALDLYSFETIQNEAQFSAISTHTWGQWTADLSTVDASSIPVIHSVQVNWIEGGAGSRLPTAGFINNRYWLAIATGTLSTKQSVLVKNKEDDNWTYFDNLKLNGMVEYAPETYFAISSTGSPVLQIENGTNDLGATISSFWESKDETFGLPSNSKRSKEFIFDYEGAASTRTVAVKRSINSGNTFTTILSPDLSGTGRLTRRVYDQGSNFYQYRYRFDAGNLDRPVTIYGLDSYVDVLRVRE